jgi:hypothetical protein
MKHSLSGEGGNSCLQGCGWWWVQEPQYRSCVTAAGDKHIPWKKWLRDGVGCTMGRIRAISRSEDLFPASYTKRCPKWSSGSTGKGEVRKMVKVKEATQPLRRTLPSSSSRKNFYSEFYQVVFGLIKNLSPVSIFSQK